MNNWVVYLMNVAGRHTGRHALCSAAEWTELDAVRPGYHALVKRFVGTEGDAEAFARSLQAPAVPARRRRLSPFAKVAA